LQNACFAKTKNASSMALTTRHNPHGPGGTRRQLHIIAATAATGPSRLGFHPVTNAINGAIDSESHRNGC